MEFTDIYKEKKKLPTPASSFIDEIATLTNRGRQAVRNWAHGRAVPEPKIVDMLSEYFKIDGDELFPIKPKRYGNR